MHILPQLAAVFLLLGSLLEHIATTSPVSWKYTLVVFLIILMHSALVPAMKPVQKAQRTQPEGFEVAGQGEPEHPSTVLS